MQQMSRMAQVLAAAVLLLLTGCGAPVPTSSPSPGQTTAPAETFLTLSPVPLMLSVPTSVADQAWVAPLVDKEIRVLQPTAAVQLQYLTGGAERPLLANLLWFTVDRFAALQVKPDAPKGIVLGFADGHVLFVQPALDMPFDPASAQGVAYGALVDRARTFRWYRMSDPALSFVRPCATYDALPTEPVDAAMMAAATRHYERQSLAPATLLQREARVLDVDAQSVGTHECANADGGLGGYVGAVPEGALRAVMLYVKHQPYPVTGGDSSFVTLAEMPGFGWLVVGEGTGP